MNKGFSLIELVITLVVIAIVGVFTFSFLGSNVRSYRLMEDQRTAHQEAANAIERISRELRDATVVAEPVGVNASSTILKMRRAHQTATDTNSYVSFCQSGGALFRCSAAGGYCGTCGPGQSGSVMLASNVTSFSVVQQGNVVGWRVNVTVDQGGYAATYTTLVFPKNPAHTAYAGCAGTKNEFCGRNFGGDYEDRIF